MTVFKLKVDSKRGVNLLVVSLIWLLAFASIVLTFYLLVSFTLM